MPPRISKIEMECFRGATRKSTLVFDDNKPIVFLFGENGSGKSTIVDAIDLVANKRLGSLENRSLGNRSKANYLPSAGKAVADMALTVYSGTNTWKATVDSAGVHIAPTSGMPDVRILRRADLIQLVEAEPAQRYRALERFIDVAEIEKCENALRDTHRALKAESDSTAKVLADATQALEDLWAKEGSPGKDAETWAISRESVDQSGLAEQTKTLSLVLTKAEELSTKIIAHTTADRNLATADSEAKQVASEVTSTPSVSGQSAIDLIRLLQTAQAYLGTTTGLTACPICEQSIVQDNLRDAITNRLSTMTTHRQLAAKQSQSAQAVQRAQTIHDAAMQEATKAIEALHDATKEEPFAKDFYDSHLATLIEPGAKENLDFSAKIKDLGNNLIPLVDTLKAEIQRMHTDIDKYNGIVTNLNRVKDNRKKATDLSLLVGNMQSALDICEEERKTFTQGILDSVASDIGLLFKEIHPDEPIGDPKLVLTRRASIDQSARFGDHTDVPPQAYYSDSHLDTFGFCVWLALAKRGDPSNRIIVLDDLFTSIDSAHHHRILKLIIAQAGFFAQTILTTHSRSLFNRPRKLGASAGNMDLKELHRWTLARGIAATTRVIFLDEIQALLNTSPLARQEISSQAGILLESVLDDLSEQYERRLPRNKANEYTLGSLLDACEKLTSVLARETKDSAITADSSAVGPIRFAFEKLREIEFIRNMVGCHHNVVGEDIADTEIEEFGKYTVAFVTELICPICKEIPWRRDSSHFSCSCKETRLHPLEFKK